MWTHGFVRAAAVVALVCGFGFLSAPSAQAQGSQFFIKYAWDFDYDGIFDQTVVGTLSRNGGASLSSSVDSDIRCGDGLRIEPTTMHGASRFSKSTQTFDVTLAGPLRDHKDWILMADFVLNVQDGEWSGRQVLAVYPASAVNGLAPPDVAPLCSFEAPLKNVVLVPVK